MDEGISIVENPARHEETVYFKAKNWIAVFNCSLGSEG